MGPSVPQNVAIRKAGVKDAEAMSLLAVSLSGEYVTAEFPDDVARSFLGAMSPHEIENKITSGFRYHVAETDGRIIGLVGVKDNTHLYHLFVSNAYPRKGVARRLWTIAMETAIAAGNSEGFTVNSSKYAKHFYEKLGFVALPQPQEQNGAATIPMKLTLGGSAFTRNRPHATH